MKRSIWHRFLVMVSVLVALAAAGGVATGAAPASAVTRLPCTYQAKVNGCHVKPRSFYITRSFGAKPMHWSRWNHTLARGDGPIASCGCDGIGVTLHRVRNGHFTRLSADTQGYCMKGYWDASRHRWKITSDNPCT